MAEKWIKLAHQIACTDAHLQNQLIDFNRRQMFDTSDR